MILGDEILAEEGRILAVRILTDKSSYNTVEDPSGRMVSLRSGDVLAGVLGSRRALRGYAGEVPARVQVGDSLEVLNLGGILGRCISENPEIGPPFQAEVLGAVLAFPDLGDRVGTPATIHDGAIPIADALSAETPVVYVAGTCMNAGKTVAATELVRGLARRGYRVGAAKLTGVSLMRDTLAMLDAGAVAALTFNDAGVASTHPGLTVPVARGLFNRLASRTSGSPDVIVAELGDGILGEYGVQDILEDRGLDEPRRGPRDGGARSGGLLGSARALSGPVPSPDHLVHRSGHRQPSRPRATSPATLGLPAHNARRDAAGLLDVVEPAIADWRGPTGSGLMRVAVLGAAGYVGGELLRLLLQHPEVTELVATSRSQAGKASGRRASGAGRAAPTRGLPRWRRPRPRVAHDVVFLALEHGESSRVMGEVIDAGPGLIVDLAADFRVQDGRLHERYYGRHPAPELVHRFRYGLADVRGAGAPRGQGHRRAGMLRDGGAARAVPLAELRAGRGAGRLGLTGSSGAGSAAPAHDPPSRAGQQRVRLLGGAATATKPSSRSSGGPGPAIPRPRPADDPFGAVRPGHLRHGARPMTGSDGPAVAEQARRAFAGRPFVRVLDHPPELTHAVGTNDVLHARGLVARRRRGAGDVRHRQSHQGCRRPGDSGDESRPGPGRAGRPRRRGTVSHAEGAA